MVDFLFNIASEIGVVFYEGSLYILIGFVVAGLLAEFVPGDLVARHLGGNDTRSITLAALFGAPIPLCSCGVLPAAAGLRRQGASKPATMSFLISTPETGVDSIALTYGLLGPVMAIVRPIVAVVTGIVAGLLATRIPDESGLTDAERSFGQLETQQHEHPDQPCHDTECQDDAAHVPAARGGRTRRVLRYGFVTLLDELAFWMVFGIALTGVIAAALPDDFFVRVVEWDRGIVPMLAMMAAGIPLYLCASASTPVAAALLAKGLSPGAALVFLMTGPATNAATMTVVGQLLGRRRLKIYLGSIAFVSLGAGLLLDAIGGEALRATVLKTGGPPDSATFAGAKTAAAALFAMLLVASLARTGWRDGLGDLRGQVRRLATGGTGLTWRDLLTGPSLAGIVIIAVLALAPKVTLVVEPGERGIVRTLGRVSGAPLEPGLHFHLPPPLGRAETVDVASIREVPVGYRGAAAGRRSGIEDASFYVTADENIIDVRSVVLYRVSDAVAFALANREIDETLASMARAELVDLLAARNIDALYTSARKEIEAAAKRAVTNSAAAAGLGIEIADVRLLDVHAPSDVHDAFRDVASAIEDRQREVRDADGYAAEQAAAGGGLAVELRERAAAAAAAQIGDATGRAAAFTGLVQAHRSSPHLTELRLYLETLERTLQAPRKYVNGSRRTAGEIDLWIGASDAVRLPALPDAGSPELP